MAMWIKIALVCIVLASIVLGSILWFASRSWDRMTSQFVEKLNPAIQPHERTRVSFENLQQLPIPVARYFQRVLKEGQPLIRSVRIVWAGEFRTSEGDDGWAPMDATQRYVIHPPGFVWDACIGMAPLITVRVRDAYVAGQGAMQAKILSLITMVDEHEKAELNAGALLRYLAEAVWFPTLLLPGNGVVWSAIDDTRALATLTNAGTTVSLEFRFNEEGEITEVFSPGRYREVNGRYELTPWAGHFHCYEERAGVLIPVEGDVEWLLPDGGFPYWKGHIVEITYDFER